MKHKHYQVLVQWLADQTLELEFSLDGDQWLAPVDATPISTPNFLWRIRPKMVKVGRHEWPMPMRDALDEGSAYWVACPGGVLKSVWGDDELDQMRLSAGMIHLTQEAAQQHADALACINRGDV